MKTIPSNLTPETEFLDVMGPKVSRVFRLAIHRYLYTNRFYPCPQQKWFETVLEFLNNLQYEG